MRFPRSQFKFEEIVKKSKFIAFLCPVITEVEFKSKLDELWNQHNDATHICWAYRVLDGRGLVSYRFSDDGEPTGSAGKPILSHMDGGDLINCAVYVVRYFGGVKLGVGGLVKAYGGACGEVIKLAKLFEYKELVSLKVRFSYQHEKDIEREISLLSGKVLNRDYSDTVMFEVELEKGRDRELVLKIDHKCQEISKI